MRRISTSCVQVMEKQRINADLNIVAKIAMQINENKGDSLHSELQLKYHSHFLREKQLEFQLIQNQQEERLKQLASFINQLERSSWNDRALRQRTHSSNLSE